MKNFSTDIDNSIKVLSDDGIILYPTDTIWGIGSDATNDIAIKKIYQLKKREEKKSMIILVAQANDIEKYVFHPPKIILNFLAGQKEPTTAIFKNAMNLPPVLINEDGSIAIRIVKDAFCQKLLAKLERPIVSTSANISGDPPPPNFSAITPKIKNGVDYIVQHRQNELEIFQPSAIIRLNAEGTIEKIR